MTMLKEYKSSIHKLNCSSITIHLDVPQIKSEINNDGWKKSTSHSSEMVESMY